MVVDSSALIACLRTEAGYEKLIRAMNEATHVVVSAVTLYETRVVLLRKEGKAGFALLDGLLDTFGVAVAPFGAESAIAATEAYRRFGKGSGHPAQLNLGDCAAYALAMTSGEPLLFKGEDFTHTDVAVAV